MLAMGQLTFNETVSHDKLTRFVTLCVGNPKITPFFPSHSPARTAGSCQWEIFPPRFPSLISNLMLLFGGSTEVEIDYPPRKNQYSWMERRKETRGRQKWIIMEEQGKVSGPLWEPVKTKRIFENAIGAYE